MVDLLDDASPWRTWALHVLDEAIESTGAAINPIVYGELAVPFPEQQSLDDALNDFGIEKLALPYEAAFLAAQAFRLQRARGGKRTAPMSDFYIGGHAVAARMTLITRDPRPYRSYFPAVVLVTPHAS